jgi:hypothetical protein
MLQIKLFSAALSSLAGHLALKSERAPCGRTTASTKPLSFSTDAGIVVEVVFCLLIQSRRPVSGSSPSRAVFTDAKISSRSRNESVGYRGDGVNGGK